MFVCSPERRDSIVVSTPAWHAVVRGSIPCLDQACYIRCKNLALNIRDCVSLCLLEETLKAIGPFYLVYIVERGSSVVECRTLNRESPGSNPPLLPFRSLGIFVLFTAPQSTRLYK